MLAVLWWKSSLNRFRNPIKVLSLVLKQTILLQLLANLKLLSLSAVAIQQITSTL
jgi:hypothetical protein